MLLPFLLLSIILSPQFRTTFLYLLIDFCLNNYRALVPVVRYQSASSANPGTKAHDIWAEKMIHLQHWRPQYYRY